MHVAFLFQVSNTLPEHLLPPHRTLSKHHREIPLWLVPLRCAANKPNTLAVTKGQLRQFPLSLNHLLFYDKDVTNCGGEVTF